MPDYKCDHCHDTGVCPTTEGVHARYACTHCDAYSKRGGGAKGAEKHVPPPGGYDSWLDYAVDTLTDLPLDSSSFYESPPPHRRDMRAAARAELEVLRAHFSGRVSKAWDKGYKIGKCAGYRSAKGLD